jgi:hypothetical protein
MSWASDMDAEHRPLMIPSRKVVQFPFFELFFPFCLFSYHVHILSTVFLVSSQLWFIWHLEALEGLLLSICFYLYILNVIAFHVVFFSLLSCLMPWFQILFLLVHRNCIYIWVITNLWFYHLCQNRQIVQHTCNIFWNFPLPNNTTESLASFFSS